MSELAESADGKAEEGGKYLAIECGLATQPYAVASVWYTCIMSARV
jgi:hypothetical protein